MSRRWWCWTLVVLSSTRGTRRLQLSEFLIGPRRTARCPDELVTAIEIPRDSARGDSAFSKLGAREYLVISIAMCAARIGIDDGVVRTAALAVGACSPVATRLPQAEAALIGNPPDPALITDAAVATMLAPIDDVRADAAYRARAAAELVRRVVAQLGEQVPA